MILQVKQFRPQRTVKRKWMKRFIPGGLGGVLKYLWLRDDSFFNSNYLLLSLTNKFYVLMEFDSNGGLGKRKNRSPESRGYGGGLVSGRARERGVALKARLQSPSIFHSAASIAPFTNLLFLINWAPGLEIMVVKNIYLLKLWCGEKWEVSEWTITQ